MTDARQNMLDQVSRDGWAGLDIDDKRQAHQIAEMMSAAAAETAPIARCLATPDGQYLLRWLALKTVMAPPDEAETFAMTSEKYALERKFRDGMNGVFFTLVKVLQVAQQTANAKGDA